MTNTFKNYDPREMQAYLNAGRVERSQAVLEAFKSVKQGLRALASHLTPGGFARPGTPNAC